MKTVLCPLFFFTHIHIGCNSLLVLNQSGRFIVVRGDLCCSRCRRWWWWTDQRGCSTSPRVQNRFAARLLVQLGQRVCHNLIHHGLILHLHLLSPLFDPLLTLDTTRLIIRLMGQLVQHAQSTLLHSQQFITELISRIDQQLSGHVVHQLIAISHKETREEECQQDDVNDHEWPIVWWRWWFVVIVVVVGWCLSTQDILQHFFQFLRILIRKFGNVLSQFFLRHVQYTFCVIGGWWWRWCSILVVCCVVGRRFCSRLVLIVVIVEMEQVGGELTTSGTWWWWEWEDVVLWFDDEWGGFWNRCCEEAMHCFLLCYWWLFGALVVLFVIAFVAVKCVKKWAAKMFRRTTIGSWKKARSNESVNFDHWSWYWYTDIYFTIKFNIDFQSNVFSVHQCPVQLETSAILIRYQTVYHIPSSHVWCTDQRT